MSKHTPGPWDVEGPENVPFHYCQSQGEQE